MLLSRVLCHSGNPGNLGQPIQQPFSSHLLGYPLRLFCNHHSPHRFGTLGRVPIVVGKAREGEEEAKVQEAEVTRREGLRDPRSSHSLASCYLSPLRTYYKPN
jgi:hypothetical protein